MDGCVLSGLFRLDDRPSEGVVPATLLLLLLLFLLLLLLLLPLLPSSSVILAPVG